MESKSELVVFSALLLCLPGNSTEGRPSLPASALPPARWPRSQTPSLCLPAGHGSPPGGDGSGMATQGSGQRSNRVASELPRINHCSPGPVPSDWRTWRFPRTSNTTFGSSLQPLRVGAPGTAWEPRHQDLPGLPSLCRIFCGPRFGPEVMNTHARPVKRCRVTDLTFKYLRPLPGCVQ